MPAPGQKLNPSAIAAALFLNRMANTTPVQVVKADRRDKTRTDAYDAFVPSSTLASLPAA